MYSGETACTHRDRERKMEGGREGERERERERELTQGCPCHLVQRRPKPALYQTG